MSHFRGTVQGNKGSASRLGHKSGFLEVTCNGWNVGVTAKIVYNEKIGVDIIALYANGGSNQNMDSKFLIGYLVEGSKALHSNLSSIPVQT